MASIPDALKLISVASDSAAASGPLKLATFSPAMK